MVEAAMLVFIWPANQVLCVILRGRIVPRSVLHICYPVHIVHYTVVLLREHGYDAAYMAMGEGQDWTECDYRFLRYSKWMPLTLTEFWWFWRIVSKYEILHFHFMTGISQSGWEWSLLKRMGRKIVIYYSGCEARDSKLNVRLHPDMNICQDCDYNAVPCTSSHNRRLKELCGRYADLELVTTPDMRDFITHGIHFPFFAPFPELIPVRTRPFWPEGGVFRIVHVTNHPGIEGTRYIAQAVENLKAKGHRIEFIHLSDMPYHQVLAEMVEADLSIGKMKMGYYANAQIEAMCCGVPTITHVREELLDRKLKNSAFIFSSLADLEETIEHLLINPRELAEYRRRAMDSVRQLHDNDILTDRLIGMYEALRAGDTHTKIAAYEERRG